MPIGKLKALVNLGSGACAGSPEMPVCCLPRKFAPGCVAAESLEEVKLPCMHISCSHLMPRCCCHCSG